jgi:fumarate reductase flavoprotein subunit
MASYQGYAAVAYPHGSLLSWTTIEKGGILVNDRAMRFGNEDAGYSGFAPDVMAQGEYAWAIYDRRIHAIAMDEEEYAEMSAMGGIVWGNVCDIASAKKLDTDALAQTLDTYAAAAREEHDDPFGRTAFALAPLEPPYAIVTVKPGLFHTQGGLMVDGHARVLRGGGAPVPNLYAGGGAAVGISGRSGGAGYASGNGLLAALGLGRLAALHAASEIRSSRRLPLDRRPAPRPSR